MGENPKNPQTMLFAFPDKGRSPRRRTLSEVRRLSSYDSSFKKLNAVTRYSSCMVRVVCANTLGTRQCSRRGQSQSR